MAARPLHEAWRRTDHPLIDRWIGRHDVVWGPNFVVPPTRAAEVVTVHDLTPVRYPELANEFTLAFPGDDPPGARPRRLGAHPVRVRAGRGRRRVRRRPRPGRRHPPRRRRPTVRARATPSAGERWPAATGSSSPSAPSSRGRTCRRSCGRSTPWRADDADLRLVIAGADGWGAEALTAAVARPRPPRPDRAARDGSTTAPGSTCWPPPPCYAFPSVYEGFGLPTDRGDGRRRPGGGQPGRRAARGLRATAPTSSSPATRTAWPAALGRVLGDDEHRAALVERGRRVAAGYDWTRAADQLADLFREADTTAPVTRPVTIRVTRFTREAADHLR